VQAAKHARRAGRRIGRAALAASATGVVFACHAEKPDIPVLPVTSRASGQVLSVDPTASRVVFLDVGKRHAVSYGPETIVKSGAVDLTPEEIRPGDRIVVSVDPDDFDRARVIAVAARPKLPLALLQAAQAAKAAPSAPLLSPNPAVPQNQRAPQTPWNP
jgi:hypothetical protein